MMRLQWLSGFQASFAHDGHRCHVKPLVFAYLQGSARSAGQCKAQRCLQLVQCAIAFKQATQSWQPCHPFVSTRASQLMTAAAATAIAFVEGRLCEQTQASHFEAQNTVMHVRLKWTECALFVCKARFLLPLSFRLGAAHLLQVLLAALLAVPLDKGPHLVAAVQAVLHLALGAPHVAPGAPLALGRIVIATAASFVVCILTCSCISPWSSAVSLSAHWSRLQAARAGCTCMPLRSKSWDKQSCNAV